MTARQSILAICLASAVTFGVHGYQFGRSNHAVYLLDALRRTEPPVLANDWFTTQTLQYHFIFTWMTESLMSLHIAAGGFLLMYTLLVLAFHFAWRNLIGQLGGGNAAYLISVALYYLSAAGTGLGMYQFFQDSCLLPSNIANVLLLCGICLWTARKFRLAGACFGIAGIFHLNFALIGIVLWIFLWVTHRDTDVSAVPAVHARARRPCHDMIGATLLAIVPSAINIALALHAKLSRSGAMPLDQFIELYVKLRHPHHYDPSTWPVGIYIAFAWTIVPGILLLRGEARRIFIFFLSLNVIALLGAGIWYFSETLVQMTLYRFSIYVQLMGCAACGLALSRKRWLAILSAPACIVILTICAIRGPFYGYFKIPDDDTEYVAICRWVAANTPIDAVFIVPPDEQSMRLDGKRAIVVNFKGVPQLSAELMQWRQRLCDIMALTSLHELARGDYDQTLVAMRRSYGELSAGQFETISRKYAARYVVTTQALPGEHLIFSSANARYFVYDLSH